MKKTSIKNFKNFALTSTEKNNTKGGIFCEIYVGYTEATGEEINSGQLQKGMNLDAVLATEGLSSALQKGGQNYINKYS